MELSRRISSLKPSPTVALNGKAKELAAKNVKVFNFAVGEPDFPTPKIIVDAAIDSLNRGRTKYGPAGGGLELRKSICKKLQRDNKVNYQPEQVVVGMGAKEILFHLFLALLDEGDEVILPAPYWVSYTAQIEACGAKAIIVPMPTTQGEPMLSAKSLAPYFTDKTKAVVLTSPNNPAGYVLSKEEMLDIGHLLKEKNCWIISDEIYEYLAFDSPHYTLTELLPELHEKFILVNGLSKGFAMTGWRVGYCAAPVAVSKLVKTLQTHSSTCLSGFTEDASVVALEAGPQLMSEQIQLLKNRRDLTESLLKEIDNIHTIPPQGAFYAYIDIRHYLKKNQMTSLQFSEALLEECHVAMVPGEAFGTPGYLRMSYAASADDITEGIARLETFLKKVGGH